MFIYSWERPRHMGCLVPIQVMERKETWKARTKSSTFHKGTSVCLVKVHILGGWIDIQR